MLDRVVALVSLTAAVTVSVIVLVGQLTSDGGGYNIGVVVAVGLATFAATAVVGYLVGAALILSG